MKQIARRIAWVLGWGAWAYGGWLGAGVPWDDELPPSGSAPAGVIHPEQVVQWQSVSAVRSEDGACEVIFELHTERGFSLYADRVEVKGEGNVFFESWQVPPTRTKQDPVSRQEVAVWDRGRFVFRFGALRPQEEETTSLEFSITYTSCSDGICLFPHTQDFSMAVGEPSPSSPAQLSDEVRPTQRRDGGTRTRPRSRDWADWVRTYGELSGVDAWWVWVLVAVAGLVTNLTPCVLPMIPITLRALTLERRSRLGSAAAYGLGIVLAYLGIGIFALGTGKVFAGFLSELAIQLGLAGLLLLLAASLVVQIGMGPFSQLGYRIERMFPENWRALGMGMGAGFVAAPCTGPVLAAVLTLASQKGTFGLGLGMIALYALGFALPYGVLLWMPLAGRGWKLPAGMVIATKQILAGIIVALALSYLELALPLRSLAHPVWRPLAWALAVMCFVGFALVQQLGGFWRLKLAGSVGLLLWLLAVRGGDTSTTASLPWTEGDDAAWSQAQIQQKPVLIDLRADWCAACTKMEETTFRDPQVVSALRDQYILLRLDLTRPSDANREVEHRYQVVGLPTVVIVGDVAVPSEFRKLEGFADAARFLDFLGRPER